MNEHQIPDRPAGSLGARLRKRVAAFLVILAALLGGPLAFAQKGPAALVLYDAPAGQPYEKMGKAYAIMLSNLLGHWDAKIDAIPVQEYTTGKMENYQTIFYLGSWYDNPLPAAFLRDVDTTSKTVVWFKYNLWQLSRVEGFDSVKRFGFRFLFNRGLSGDPAAATPDFFDTVNYKGQALRKYYAFDAAANSVLADPDIGYTEIVDSARVQTLATIGNRANLMEAPYAMRSGNFWYIADMPFSYIGPRDRYLVISDLLHDIIGVSPPSASASRRALVRLEDVSALTSSSTLRRLSDWLSTRVNPATAQPQPVPFSIALIPHFVDPLGVYNGGTPLDIPLNQASTLRNDLNYALARGGRIVMHGVTHQVGTARNPWTGVSGDDYEFWDIVGNQVVPGDNLDTWRARLDEGLKLLSTSGYSTTIFETPHYQGSPSAYRATAEKFSKVYERAVYYTSETPQLGAGTNDRDYAVGQFFPYVIERDWYGRKVLPENLGNIEYDIREIDPSAVYTYAKDELIENARVLTALVRDSIPSFFFHPFWLETFRRPDGTPYAFDGFADFKQVMDAISAMGFTWTDPTGL